MNDLPTCPPNSETAPRRFTRVLAATLLLGSCRTPLPWGEHVFRPEQIGARADGIHDDSRFIQRCIDQAAQLPADENGRRGTVQLDGTYYVTRQAMVVNDTTSENDLDIGPHWRVFHVPSGVTITGRGTVTLLQGGQSSRTHPAHYNYVFWVAQDPQRWPGPAGATDPEHFVRHVTIRDISIVNDPAALMYAPWSETAAIWIYSGAGITIDGVKTRHFHRGVAVANSRRTHILGCTIEDSRYIGIANYQHAGAQDAGERNLIEANEVVGNTHLSGGIYVSGPWTDIRDNRLSFTRGIWLLGYEHAVVEGNHIRRSPVPIRLGYGMSDGARSAVVRDNFITGSTSGIMVNGAVDCTVAENRIQDFIERGTDPMIEPPRGGYWGYGRVRAGIHVEDSQNVRITDNVIRGLSSGCPVGISVTNSRLTTDAALGPYAPTHQYDPPARITNHGNVVKGNRVRAESGLRIGFYLENQEALAFQGNSSTGEASNRMIHCTGPVGKNRLSRSLQLVDHATAQCRRLVTRWHPMHPRGDPLGPHRFTAPVPENEYFPLIEDRTSARPASKMAREEMGAAYPY